MMPNELIEQALGSPAKIRVLRILKKQGSGFMSLRQLAGLASLNAVTLSRTLRSLKELGLVDYIQTGRSHLWRLMPSYASYVVARLLDSIHEAPRLYQVLQRLLEQSKPIPDDVEEIILYGSAASDEATLDSDIDLCVLLKKEPRSGEVENFFDRLRQEIFEAISMRVSLLHWPKKRFHLLKEPLRSNIRNGVVLYEKSSK